MNNRHPKMTFRRLMISTFFLGAALQLNAAGHAQTNPMASRRALNLARDTAVQINGGLSNYRPARCMYQGIAKNPCLAYRDANRFIFQFPGGSPGWQETGMAPGLVTVLEISADGRSVTQGIHNGPLPQR